MPDHEENGQKQAVENLQMRRTAAAWLEIDFFSVPGHFEGAICSLPGFSSR